MLEGTSALLKVSDKLGDTAMKAYHEASLDEAKAAQNLPKECRRYRSLLLPLSEDEFDSLTSEVESFSKELIAKFQANRASGRRVYKVNLNYYPICRKLEG